MIRIFSSLLMLLLIMVLVRLGQTFTPGIGSIGVTVTLGMIMLGAWLAGRFFDQMNLPKISGYLLFGLMVGPSLFSQVPIESVPQILRPVWDSLPLVTLQDTKNLRFIGDLTVALIALTAGGEIRLDWLRGQARKLATIIGIDVLLMLPAGMALVWFGAPYIPFLRDADNTTIFVVALLTSSVMISNSPTVVIAMLSDLRSAGPLSQMTLALTVCKDMVLMVAFAVAMSIGKAMLEPGGEMSAEFLIGVGAQIFGSFIVGSVIGVAMAFYVHRVRAHLTIFIIGCALLVAVIGEQELVIAGQPTHLEPLLMALAAGLVMQNIWPATSAPLFHTVEHLSLPVYCVFFALAGAKIDLDVFKTLWYVSLGLACTRAISIWIGINTGLRVAGLSREPWANKVWYGMIPQAGVTFVLVTLLGRSFAAHPWALDLTNMLIGMIVIHELVGPIGFRHALMSMNEVGKADEAEPQHK